MHCGVCSFLGGIAAKQLVADNSRENNQTQNGHYAQDRQKGWKALFASCYSFFGITG